MNLYHLIFTWGLLFCIPGTLVACCLDFMYARLQTSPDFKGTRKNVQMLHGVLWLIPFTMLVSVMWNPWALHYQYDALEILKSGNNLLLSFIWVLIMLINMLMTPEFN